MKMKHQIFITAKVFKNLVFNFQRWQIKSFSTGYGFIKEFSREAKYLVSKILKIFYGKYL